MNAGKMTHRANIYRPLETIDDRGQEHGEELVMAGVPCSIEPINSRELEAARQVYAAATHRVRMYGDPKKPLAHSMFLKVNGRRLNIGEIRDLYQNGEQYELLCGEKQA